jgi:cysteine desulfuration protein SufE
MTDRQRQLIEDFNLIENPQERLSAIVDRARRMPHLADADRTDSHRVPGCISQVWLVSEIREGHCHFHCDADGPLVKGLVTFLCDYCSETTPADLLADTTDPLAALDLLNNLSPTRRNGLAAVRTAIKSFAQSQV